MRGTQNFQRAMFSYISLEERVPAKHPLRKLRSVVDALLATLMLLDSDCSRIRLSPLRSSLAYVVRNYMVRLSDGWGQPDEMLSARAWRLREAHPWLRRVIDALFFWDKSHCAECYLIEYQRRQLPSEYRV